MNKKTKTSQNKKRRFGLNKTEFAIIKALRNEGPLTRPQLSKKLTLTRASMTQMISPMLEKGWLEKINPVKTAQRGSNTELISIGKNKLISLGIFISQHGVKMAMLGLNNSVICKEEINVDFRAERSNPHEYITKIISRILFSSFKCNLFLIYFSCGEAALKCA